MGVLSQSQAQIYSLNNNNSVAQINVGSSAGIFNWSVDGQNQLAQSWFWYRVGSTPEAPINAISPAIINSYVNIPALNKLDITYGNTNYSVSALFQVAGQTAGSGRSSMGQTITVANLSGSSLDFHLFQYSDFDLGGVTGSQSVQYFLNGITGQYYQVVQTFGSRSVTETVNSATPPIGHVEAGLFNATLVKLNDGVASTLNDNLAIGPGDATFAYEWDVTLAPGATFQISKILAIVPEPSIAALLGLGTGIVTLYRRRRSS